MLFTDIRHKIFKDLQSDSESYVGTDEWSDTELDTSAEKSKSGKQSPAHKPSSVEGDVSQCTASGQGLESERESSHHPQASALTKM